jgi:hypothetical protein
MVGFARKKKIFEAGDEKFQKQCFFNQKFSALKMTEN